MRGGMFALSLFSLVPKKSPFSKHNCSFLVHVPSTTDSQIYGLASLCTKERSLFQK
jgi:hypothetical protein